MVCSLLSVCKAKTNLFCAARDQLHTHDASYCGGFNYDCVCRVAKRRGTLSSVGIGAVLATCGTQPPLLDAYSYRSARSTWDSNCCYLSQGKGAYTTTCRL